LNLQFYLSITAISSGKTSSWKSTKSDARYTDKLSKINFMKIYSGAPRGSGVKGMTSEFAAMRVGSNSGRSSSRSVPYSSMSETQPQATEKRGT
jgi:hypothetical protein